MKKIITIATAGLFSALAMTASAEQITKSEEKALETIIKLQHEILKSQQQMMAIYRMPLKNISSKNITTGGTSYIEPMLRPEYSESLLGNRTFKITPEQMRQEEAYWNNMTEHHYDISENADLVNEAYNRFLVNEARIKNYNKPKNNDYIIVEKQLWDNLINNLKESER